MYVVRGTGRQILGIESVSQSLNPPLDLKGRTRMLLTSIPYFKEVIIMSFRCEHCGASNNEIQSAGAYRGD
jgi:ZPR1 zinc-finger domain